MVDTSAILAVLFAEPHGERVVERLADHAGELRVSTINLAETLILLRDRQPQIADDIEERVLDSGIRFVPPDADLARIAAAPRLRYALNLGDVSPMLWQSRHAAPSLPSTPTSETSM